MKYYLFQPQTQTSTAAPAFGGFGLGSTAAATTSAAPAPAFGGFGAPAATASVAPTLGGFGAPATTSAAPPSFGFATAASSAAAAPPSFGGFGATTSTTTATVSGLGGNTNAGGLLGSQAGKPASSEENKTDGSGSKESPIPAELNTTVEAFKNFIKEEKSVSSEISHNTDKQMKQVKEDTEGLSHLVSSLSSTLQSNRSVSQSVRMEIITFC